MKENGDWKQGHNAVAQLLSVINCFSVVVENKELVDPELDQKHEEIHDVQNWHSRWECNSDKDGE